jgi:hypothetical protein
MDIKNIHLMLETCDKTLRGTRDRAILLFLLDTGLRARELLSMEHQVTYTGTSYTMPAAYALTGPYRNPVVVTKTTKNSPLRRRNRY